MTVVGTVVEPLSLPVTTRIPASDETNVPPSLDDPPAWPPLPELLPAVPWEVALHAAI